MTCQGLMYQRNDAGSSKAASVRLADQNGRPERNPVNFDHSIIKSSARTNCDTCSRSRASIVITGTGGTLPANA